MSPPDPDRPTLSLEDRQAIIDATILYCWAIDSKSYADLNGVFTDDVLCNYSSLRPPFNGREALKEMLAAALEPLDLTQHMLSNHQIESRASGPWSRCYFHAQHVRADVEGHSNYVVAGIYEDDWRKTAEGWRSCGRTLRVLWTEGNPAVMGG